MARRVVSVSKLRLGVLLESERTGETVTEICRRYQISRQTCYRYRRRPGRRPAGPRGPGSHARPPPVQARPSGCGGGLWRRGRRNRLPHVRGVRADAGDRGVSTTPENRPLDDGALNRSSHRWRSGPRSGSASRGHVEVCC